jgi:hypothetical protein
MANDHGKPVSRRDTFKLAAAVGALGAGLGALLETDEARAEDAKIEQKALGTLAFKIYDLKEGADYTLVKTFELADFVKLKINAKQGKIHNYCFKFWYVQDKHEPVLLKSQDLAVTSNKIKMG